RRPARRSVVGLVILPLSGPDLLARVGAAFADILDLQGAAFADRVGGDVISLRAGPIRVGHFVARRPGPDVVVRHRFLLAEYRGAAAGGPDGPEARRKRRWL